MRKLLMIMLLATGLCFATSAQPVSAFDAFGTNQYHCTSADKARSAVCKVKAGPTKDPISGKDGILVKATTIIAWMGGAAAIILLILGGIRLMTANGDPGKIASARGTVINAMIGLVIIGLSSAIILFVLEKF